VGVAHLEAKAVAEEEGEDRRHNLPPQASLIQSPRCAFGTDHQRDFRILKTPKSLVHEGQVHEVNVKVHDDVSSGSEKSRPQGRAVVGGGKPDCRHLVVGLLERSEFVGREVSGPVFRDDDFERLAPFTESSHDRNDGLLEVPLLIVGRHDDRDHGSLMLSARRRSSTASQSIRDLSHPRPGSLDLLLWGSAGLGCGLLVALSVPPFGFWPFAWFGFAGLALMLPGRSPSARFAMGFGAGLGQYVVGLAWVSEFSIPGCAALMVLGGLFVAFTLLVVPTSRVRTVVLAVPAAFVLSDWVRARFPLGGFPLGGTSLGQALSPLVPSTRIGGSLLLTGETVLVGVAMAQLVRVVLAWHAQMRSAGRDRPSGAIVRSAASALVLLATVAVAIPVAGILAPTGAGGHLAPIRVALVQGGGARGTRAIHTDPQIVFDRHMTASEAIRPPVDLVVMPEGILQTDQAFTSSDDAAEVSMLAQTLGATVVVGVEQDVGTTRYLNEVAAWSPSGTVVAVYVKNHLVPFGEYVPFRSVIARVFNVSDVPLDAIRGHRPGYMNTPAAPLGVMVSYEVFFDERARGGVRAGGQILIVPTNTASYRSSQVPTQELAAARLRAWETGRWVLQVTPTGYSAVLSASGRVLERSTLGRQAVLEATAKLETGRTIYVNVGDAPFAAGAAALLLWAWMIGRRDRSALEGNQSNEKLNSPM
jgi:apolipoprotein N-acyltransferase